MHVLPAAQTVAPVQPVPPHCPYFGTVTPLTAPVVAAAAEVLVFTEVVKVVFVAAATDVLAPAPLPLPLPPDH